MRTRSHLREIKREEELKMKLDAAMKAAQIAMDEASELEDQVKLLNATLQNYIKSR